MSQQGPTGKRGHDLVTVIQQHRSDGRQGNAKSQKKNDAGKDDKHDQSYPFTARSTHLDSFRSMRGAENQGYPSVFLLCSPQVKWIRESKLG